MQLPFDSTFLELIPAAVYAVGMDGTIAYFNAQAAELWGQTPTIGHPDWKWCGAFEVYEQNGTPIAKDQCIIVDVLKNGTTIKDHPMLVDRPDGSRIHVLASVGPIRDSAGTIVGAINTFRDVTEQKESEARLEQALASAESANASKDRFLAMLSHELRTPLAPVVMTIAAMEADPELPPCLRDDIATVRRNIGLEVKLIDDLLDLSRISNGKLALDRRDVRVHDLLAHVLACCVSETNEKRLRIERDFTAANDRVVADPARLQQVFWNLLRNATKFTPTSGVVRVRTYDDEQGQLCVQVTDNGIGIRAEQLPKIFGAFEQGDARTINPQSPGLGLGLAIVKAIVDLHGGSISAASDGPNTGATFTVRLQTAVDSPKHLNGTPTESIRTTPTDGVAPTPIRILLVEDHADTAKVLSRLLQMEGYAVQTAGTVAAALELAAAQSFDLLLSDIGLPDASGHDLMMKVRDLYQMKGICLSGYGMEDDVRRGHTAGFDAHVTKPVDVDRLIAVIAQVATPRVNATLAAAPTLNN